MRPRPRARRAVKWGGLAASAVLLGVWVGSAWYGIVRTGRIGTDYTFVGVGRGIVRVAMMSDPNPADSRPGARLGWSVQPVSPPQFAWWFRWESVTGPVRFKSADVPLWLPMLLTAVVTGWCWRHDAAARRRDGGCPACGYSRAGLPPGAVCPECGTGGKVGEEIR